MVSDKLFDDWIEINSLNKEIQIKTNYNIIRVWINNSTNKQTIKEQKRNIKNDME